MAGKAITKETIKRNTIRDMKSIGVYDPGYDPIIDTYAELREQYNRLTKTFKDSKYKVEESTADGGKKKAPIVAALESLRKDILSYSDRLCLNPKSVDSVDIKKKKSASKLVSFLEKSQ